MEMTHPQLALLLFGIGLVLMFAELVLPTHGVLGVAAGGAIITGIVVCYMIDFRLGTGVLIGTAVASPFLGALAMKIWPKTPIGRRVMLPPVTNVHVTADLRIGQSGVTVSELRPMGVCEFDTGRFEAMSEHGLIAPGRAVKVVSVEGSRATVRAV